MHRTIGFDSFTNELGESDYSNAGSSDVYNDDDDDVIIVLDE